MRDNIVVIISVICITIMSLGLTICETIKENKAEQIKILEQSLQEQIQETEVYRNILETYQIEGIINE